MRHGTIYPRPGENGEQVADAALEAGATTVTVHERGRSITYTNDGNGRIVVGDSRHGWGFTARGEAWRAKHGEPLEQRRSARIVGGEQYAEWCIPAEIVNAGQPRRGRQNPHGAANLERPDTLLCDR